MSRHETNRGAMNARPLERLARGFAWTMVAFFGLAAAWGMFGVSSGGHYGAADGIGISAENMIQWKIIAPVWEYTPVAPTSVSYYCHHPFGCFWAMVPLFLLGHHHVFVFVPAVLMSTGTIWMLYDIGRMHWGPVGGAAAAAAFATVPITLSFSNFASLELITMFGWALFFWGHSKLLLTWKRRWAFVSVAGAGIACTGDWPGFVVIGILLGWGLLRAYVLPARLTAPLKPERYGQWWALATAVAVFWFVVWLGLFIHYDKLTDLLYSGRSRSTGSELPLAAVLEARKHRIDLMFTPPVILLGKIALPLSALRFLVTRRDAELYALAAWVAATFQYVVFKQGADIHIFWPHYFGFYFALAFAQLVATLVWIVTKVLARFRVSMAPRIGFGVGLALTVLWALAIMPDALRVLRYGRETAGRYNQEAMPPERDAVRVVTMLSKRLPVGATLDTHTSHEWGWHLSFALHGLHKDVATLPTRADVATDPLFFARASKMRSADLIKLAADFQVELYGDLVVVDKRTAPGPLNAWTFAEKEPNPLEWFFLGGVEPVQHIVHDPYATWEWRTHLGQTADAPPSEAPTTIDQRRIAHNMAVAAGDGARAMSLANAILAELDQTPAVPLSDGSRLLGVRRIEGTSPRLEIWFMANGPTDGDALYGVRARMEGRNPWSFIPPDTLDRSVGSHMSISPRLWRKGFLYRATVTLYHRIGVEVFAGGFYSRDGSLVPNAVVPDGGVDLATYR
jgi:hypothetical protein